MKNLRTAAACGGKGFPFSRGFKTKRPATLTYPWSVRQSAESSLVLYSL